MKTATPDPQAEIPAARNQTMTAIAQDHYGTTPNEVLRLAKVAKPNIGDDDILVRVRAAGVDRGTWHLMTGPALPRPIRGLRRPPPQAVNLGRSMAGTVEAVGTNVTEFALGDQVYGTCNGSFAEYAGAQAGRLASKPANVSYEQAAAIPVSGLTALQASATTQRCNQDRRY
jgi:NADPH:quinone reductase-like Zn-dependent oxidoreductase